MNMNVNNNTPNFNGKVLLRGGWTSEMAKAFTENKDVQALAKGEHNIIGIMRTKKAHFLDINHIEGENLYRLSLAAEKEKPSILDRIKSALGFADELNVTNTYHREEKMFDYIAKQINANNVAQKLDIKL